MGIIRSDLAPGGYHVITDTPTIRERPELLEDRLGRNGPKVLVVDDEEPIRNAYREHLERAGYRVVEASDGREGLERLKSERDVSVVLADHEMPGMKGLEMAAGIKGLNPKTGVILISGSEDLRERFKTSPDPNVDVFLAKPVNFKQDVLPHVERLCKLTS
ncbi:MAG: response regulator [Candidatus Altiarchaeota archaeon]